MGILLDDEQIESITAKALGDNPHWQPDAWGLFNVVAKAQLKKVVEWGDEPCPHHQNISAKRYECCICTMDIWQALLKEAK